MHHGLDGVILYDETSRGLNPVKAVQILADCCVEAEHDQEFRVNTIDETESKMIDDYFEDEDSKEAQ